MTEAVQRMLEMSQAFTALSADWWRLMASTAGAQTGDGRAAAESLEAAFAAHYQRLLMPAMPPLPLAGGAAPELSAALARCQRAGQALAALVSSAAADAGRAFVAELSRTDADAAPIETLRALHGLWIECGEGAWATAVRQDVYAEAQGEWLASLVELQLAQRRLQAAASSPPA